MLGPGAGATPNNDRGRNTADYQAICRKRLYDPAAGAYLTLTTSPEWSRTTRISSSDAATGEDITPSVLKQIIVERSAMANPAEPVTIKKYANRRLYNTGTSSYVTLEDLATMVKAGEDFVV